VWECLYVYVCRSFVLLNNQLNTHAHTPLAFALVFSILQLRLRNNRCAFAPSEILHSGRIGWRCSTVYLTDLHYLLFDSVAAVLCVVLQNFTFSLFLCWTTKWRIHGQTAQSEMLHMWCMMECPWMCYFKRESCSNEQNKFAVLSSRQK